MYQTELHIYILTQPKLLFISTVYCMSCSTYQFFVLESCNHGCRKNKVKYKNKQCIVSTVQKLKLVLLSYKELQPKLPDLVYFIIAQSHAGIDPMFHLILSVCVAVDHNELLVQCQYEYLHQFDVSCVLQSVNTETLQSLIKLVHAGMHLLYDHVLFMQLSSKFKNINKYCQFDIL